MALIAIFISLVLERILGSLEELRRFGWFLAYYRWAAPRLARLRGLNGALGILLLLLPLIAPVVALDYYLDGLGPLLGLAFAVLTLLYCFGPHDLEAEVEAFIDAHDRGDEESACWHASELLGDEELICEGGETPRIMANIFVEANERLLAIVCWFILLGPAGALLYRLSSQVPQAAAQEEDAIGEAGRRLHQLLGWLPARLCAIAYALAGSFVDAIHGWRSVESGWLEGSREVLINSGFGALRFESDETQENRRSAESVGESLALVRRAVLVFLALLAFATLAGWMG
jgi:membrane protein required for beta-lactamase induction